MSPSEEVTNVDVDESGEELYQDALSKKAREPKTEVQKRFVSLFPGMKYFPTKAHHKRFREFELLTLSGSDESVIHRGYLINISDWVKKKNVTSIVIRMGIALNMLEDTDRYKEYAASKAARDFLAANKSAVKSTIGIKTIGRPLG